MRQRRPHMKQQEVFLEAVEQWLHSLYSLCSYVVSHHPNEIICEGDSNVVLCQGVHKYEPREFLSDPAPFLIFHVHEFFNEGFLTSLEGMASSFTRGRTDNQYSVVAATFSSPDRYSTAICIPDHGWFFIIVCVVQSPAFDLLAM